MKHTVTITFPDEETRDNFMGWFSDGGGEYAYMEASGYHDEKPINMINYARAFPAWGYKPEIHGSPVIVCVHIDDDDE